MGETTLLRVGEANVSFNLLSIEGPAGKFAMEPKVMNLLQALIDNAGEVVSRQDLLDQVWAENFGGDESLSRAVSLLRRAFGEVRGGNQYIETVPKRGYRLVAQVNVEVGQPQQNDASTTDVANKDAGEVQTGPPRGKGWLAVLVLAMVLGSYLYEPTPPATSGSPSAKAVTPGRSVAIIPFTDLSTAGDQQYLADGLAEEMLNALVKLPDLRVSGRTSSFRQRGQDIDPLTVGSTLSVSHIVTGSVRKQDDRIRIIARLVETGSGATIWSENYDDDLTDVFDLQEDIAREIARNLGIVLDLSGPKRVVMPLTEDQEAYDLFLQGRTLTRKFGHQNRVNAVALLERAVLLDPDFAVAWAWLGQAYIYLTLTAEKSMIPNFIGSAREAVDRALSIDPEMAIAHYAKTILLDYDLDFAASVDALEVAYELSPSQPLLAIRRGHYRSLIGQNQAGAQMMQEGLRWDPTDAVGLMNLGVAQHALGQVEAAHISVKRSSDLGFEPASIQLCLLKRTLASPAEGLACWEDLSNTIRSRYPAEFRTPKSWTLLGRAMFYQDAAARKKIGGALDSFLRKPDSYTNSYLILSYIFIGQPERFMALFQQRPYPINAGSLHSIWSMEPESQEFRQHPAFPEFARNIGLVAAWDKYGWPDLCEGHTVEGQLEKIVACR